MRLVLGRSAQVRSFNCDMYWLRLNRSSENSGFGRRRFLYQGGGLYWGEGIMYICPIELLYPVRMQKNCADRKQPLPTTCWKPAGPLLCREGNFVMKL